MKRIWVWTIAGLLTLAVAAAWQVKAQSPVVNTQSVQLRNADAGLVAPKLKAMLGERGAKTEIRVDQRSNRVLIRGAADDVRIANQMIQMLDRPAVLPPMESTPVVRGYGVEAANLEQVADQLRGKFATDAAIRIATDNRTSQILVVAPPEMQPRVAEAIRQSAPAQPAPTLGPAPDSRASHPLANITWRELETRLKQLWGDDIQLQIQEDGAQTVVRAPRITGDAVIMQIDRRENVVRLPGNDGMAGYWLQVVKAVDAAQTIDRAAALLPMGRAEPSKIREVVDILSQAALTATNGAAALMNAGGQDMVSMVFQQSDGAAQDTPLADIPPGEEEDTGLIGDVQLQFVPELGIIIIRGHRRDVEKVKKIIARIEKESQVSRPEVEVVPMEHVNSRALADLINPIYTEVYLPRQGSLSITALGKPNALLLIGRMENIEIAKELIAELDKPVPPQTVVRVFQLQHMSATTAAEEIQQLYSGENAAGGADGDDATSLETRVNVIADFRSNSIIVQAGPRDMSEIEDLLKRLDTLETPAKIEVRVFPLKNALAETLAETLSSAIAAQTSATTGGAGGQAGQADDGVPSRSVQFVASDGEKIIESGILAEVVITADSNTNSLIVRAPAKSMTLIAALIARLDDSPEAESQIKVFEIRNGDATNLTLMLQELFGLEVTAGTSSALRQTLGAIGAGAQQLNQQSAGESSLIPLRFTPEGRTNSIIASGSAADLDIVEALLLRLDEDNVRGRSVRVYRLNNASADAVATALDAILSQQLQLYQTQVNQQFSTIGQQEFLDQQVFVQPEINTNSVLVSATPELFEMITDVIQDLDRRPPMIMIQVMIAQVMLDEREETGAELGIQDSFLFDRGLAQPGGAIGYNFVPSALPNGTDTLALGSRGVLGSQGFSAFGVGRTSAAAGFPGLVLSASNESISLLMRALESSSRVQMLSRPQIMTMHNVPASILVGQRVPRVTDVTQNVGGTTSGTTLDDIGLSLGVIPRVTPDGLIVMDVEVAKSSVGDPAAGIPIAVQDGVAINSPIYSDTTAITTLSARDGQTIVFSGLIDKERSDSYRGVPFLSTIPVVGRLFRFDQHNETRSELLIFLTPHIVHSGEVEQVDWINATESERMSWCLADVIEMHGNVGLSPGRPGVWSPKECPVIFPDGAPMHESPMPIRSIDEGRPFVAPEEAGTGRPHVEPNPVQGRPHINTPTRVIQPNHPTPAAELGPSNGVQAASHSSTMSAASAVQITPPGSRYTAPAGPAPPRAGAYGQPLQSDRQRRAQVQPSIWR